MQITFWAIGAALLAGDAASDLEAAIVKGAKAESYTFNVEERRGEGAGQPVEGKFQKDKPVYFKADKIEFFRRGKDLVYKQGEAWKRSKTGVESDPLLILGASAKARSTRLPHEDLAALGKNLREAKSEDEKGGRLFQAALTEEGAKKLARSEDASVARGGVVKVWTDAKSRLVKYEIAIRLQGRLGNAEIDGTATRTVTLRDIGATKVDPPEAATKALGPAGGK